MTDKGELRRIKILEFIKSYISVEDLTETLHEETGIRIGK